MEKLPAELHLLMYSYLLRSDKKVKLYRHLRSLAGLPDSTM
jgi:hypothetical protein